jgi:AcrR family transcriptional regulator
VAVQIEEGASRRHVLDCAARLFRHEGYAAVSLRDIAAESGMKAGSLYYHFESKDVIVIEVLDTGVRRVHEAVEAALAGLPGSASIARKIEAAIQAHLRALHEAGDYTSANIRIFGQVPPSVRKSHMPSRRSYEALWSTLLSAGVTSGELRGDIDLVTLRAFLLGAMNTSLDWLEPRSGAVARIARDLCSIVLNGASASRRVRPASSGV